jgi:hypothetical protein
LRPDKLKYTEDGKVEFIVEDQGCWSLATLPEGADPPVWTDSRDLDIETNEKWTKVNDSLIHVLITFCFQELTFGAKFGVWDDDLTEYFRSDHAAVQPLWLGGQYAYPELPYNFYLMDGDVLVGEFYGGDCFFGANNENGIARLKAKESRIVTLIVSTPTSWRVDVREDGSGEVGVFPDEQSYADIPPGTFDFAALRDDLLAQLIDTGDYRQVPLVSFMRSGRGYAKGQGVGNRQLIRQLFDRALAAACDKKPGHDRTKRTVPLGIE